MIGLPFLPRSPRWLAKVGREKEAIHVLAAIQANGNIDDPLVVAEWDEITTTLAAEREGQKGWRRFFRNSMWKRTFAGVSVQAWQQLSGTYDPLACFPLYLEVLVSPSTLTTVANAEARGQCNDVLRSVYSESYVDIGGRGGRVLLTYD